MQTTMDLGRVFAWLTRTGMGRHFPGTPIGWYQQHQCHAIDVLDEVFGKGADLRVEHGMVRAKGSKATIAASEVFRRADDRSRGVQAFCESMGGKATA